MKRFPAEDIEIFHIYFLEQLTRKLARRLYALKGGCNLRFFLKSIRYSQDIDIDIETVRKDTLANHVRKILNSKEIERFLKFKKIEIIGFSEPKQTEITQRWKIQLKSAFFGAPLNTKIEFSRRGINDPIKFELIDPEITYKYQFNPFFANHYTAEAAYKQKVKALIGRSRTQARDFFDLFHLICRGTKKPKIKSSDIDLAKEYILSISFEEFKSQVITYLPYEYYSQYSDPKVYENIKKKIIDEL